MSKNILIEGSTYTNVGHAISRFGGFGRFQQLLTACFSLMVVPGTFSTLIMYFAALKPGWKCSGNSSACNETGTFSSDDNRRCSMQRSDWEYTEQRTFSIVTQFDIFCDREWIIYLSTSVLFIGWALGAVILGWISDNFGRKLVIFPSNLVIILVGFIAAFSPSTTFLMICRFIIGFFMPGAGVQTVVLLSEFVSTKYRPYAVSIVWLFFTVALCLLALKAYLVMNWKILFIICTAPYLYIMVFYKFVPESIRWLHVHQRSGGMLKVFQRMGYWNKKTIPEGFNVLPLERRSLEHKANPLDLFRTRKMAVSTLSQGYLWLVNGMVYYGLSLASDDLGGSLYTNFVLLCVIEFPAYLIAMYVCDKIGRKKSTLGFMAFGGIACILVAFIPSTGNIKTFRVVLGMLGKLSITISFSAIYVWSLEIYSTNIRAEGMGFLQITSRIGAASSPWIAKGLRSLHPFAPFIVMGTLSLIGAFVCLLLPETNGKPIQDTNDEESGSVLEGMTGDTALITA